MNEVDYELRRPRNVDEWRAFHAIRRRVLFENRGKREKYVDNNPDDSQPGNHPLALLYRGEIIGVMRLDVSESVGWLRSVAIREDLQRVGHGRVLLKLAEAFARAQGCDDLITNAAVEAVGFYDRCDYARDLDASSPPNSVRMWKRLR